MSRSVLLVGLLTALAAVLRFAGIGHQSFWLDEAGTAWLMHHSFAVMLERLQGTETSPPFYFILGWLWTHVFGDGEAGLRSLSALAGVATVPVAYAAGAKLMSRRAGLIVAAITACNPLLVWYSQEARAYSLMVLLTAVALLAFAHLRAQPSRGWVITWSVASALALATHYYAALVIVPQAIWLFAHYRPIRMIRFGVEAVVAATSPLAVLAFKELKLVPPGSNWIVKVSLAQRVSDVPKMFAVGPSAPSQWLIAVSAIAVVAGAWLVVRRADARERSRIFFVARLGASGCALVVALIVLGFDQLDYRNLLALWLPVALVIGGALGIRRAGAVGAAAAALLCAIGMTTVIAVAADGRLQRPDWRGVANTLGSRPERAIFAVDGCQLLPLSLYLPGLQFAPAGGVVVKEIDVIDVADQSTWYQVLFSGWYGTCLPRPRDSAIPQQLGSFREHGKPTHVGQFSVTRLMSRGPLRVTQRTFADVGLRGALMLQEPGRSGSATGYSAP